MINRLPWRKKLRTSAANNLDKINEIVDYINHSDISPVALSESGSGRSVTVGVSSSLKSLTVHGESIQDGTPTPDAPVDVQTVEAPDDGQFGILIGDTVTPIDLQGNVLASLPDGTHDRLLVDSAGHVTLEKNVGLLDLSSLSWTWNTSWGSWYTAYQSNIVASLSNTVVAALMSETLQATTFNQLATAGKGPETGVTLTASSIGGAPRVLVRNDSTENTPTGYVYYHLAIPETIELGYIDMPTIESGDAISVSATITPVIDVAYYKTAGGQEQTAGLNMSRPDNISLDMQAEQPTIVEESEMI